MYVLKMQKIYNIIMYLEAVITIPCNHDYIMDVKLWC